MRRIVRMKIIDFGLIFTNIILLVTGQTLFKIGLSKVSFSLENIFKIIFQPYVFIGLIIYVVATVIWFYVLTRVNLSMAYPIQSLCYVLAAFVGMFIFKEIIPPTRWIGISLIVIGAGFVALK